MSIAPLNDRIDELVGVETQAIEKRTTAETLPIPDGLEQPANPTTDPAASPVLVAGVGPRITNIIREAIAPSRALPVDATQAEAVKQEMVKAAKQRTDVAKPGLITPKKKKDEMAGMVPVEPGVYPSTLLITRPDEKMVDKFISGMDAPAVGVDFNFNNIQTVEDNLRAIDETSKIYAKQISVMKRDVIRDETLKDLANRLDVAPELLSRGAGETLNAEQLLASRHLLVRSADKLNDLAQKIKSMPMGTEDDKLLLEFRTQMATHASIQMQLKGAVTEAARALRSMRLPVDGTAGISDPNVLANLLNEVGGRKTMKELASDYINLSDAEKARFIQMAGGWKKNLSDIWREMYTSSIMYSTASIERNLFGAGIMTFIRSMDTSFASTAGKALDVPITAVFGSRSSDQVYAAEAAIELANFFTAIPKAWAAGGKAFVTETPQYAGRDAEKYGANAGLSARLFSDPESLLAKSVDFMGKAIRMPFRANMASDEIAKATVAQMETRRLAARQAIDAIHNGMPESQALDAMAAQIANPDPAILEKVNRAVLEPGLQTELGQFGNWLMKVRNDAGPVGTVLAPFIKSVINMQKEGFKRTPFAPIFSEVQADLAAGGARRQMALGKMSMGTSVMGMFYQSALNGNMTGAGPSDPKMREYLRQQPGGWQPFSYKVGDTWVSYAGLEPFGILMATASTLAEVGSVYGKPGDDDWNDLLLYSALLPMKYVGELPFMQGVSNFVGMVEAAARDPKGEDAANAAAKFFGGVAQNFPAGVVPIPTPGGALIRQFETMTDPTARRVTLDPSLPADERYFMFMYQSWAAKTPILNKSIKPTRNVWGEEVSVGETGPLYLVWPFFRKDAQLDSVSKTLVEISKLSGKSAINMPGRSINNVKLNDEEYSDLLLAMNKVRIEGRSMRSRIASVTARRRDISVMKYQDLIDEISGTVSDYKRAAYESPEFASQYPDLVRQIRRNQILAERGMIAPKRIPAD
jgi:hypothetical protein